MGKRKINMGRHRTGGINPVSKFVKLEMERDANAKQKRARNHQMIDAAEIQKLFKKGLV
jgi:hypothetical protein